MPTSKSKAEPRFGTGTFSYDPLVMYETCTINLDGAPPDTAILISVTKPTGGVWEDTITSDDNGHLSFEMVFNGAGQVDMAATAVQVVAIGADSTMVAAASTSDEEVKETKHGK